MDRAAAGPAAQGVAVGECDGAGLGLAPEAAGLVEGEGFGDGLGDGDGVAKCVHCGSAHHGGTVDLDMTTRWVDDGKGEITGVGLHRSSVPVGSATSPLPPVT